MGLAAFTRPDIVKMIDSAALLCPISYLDHVSATFVLRAVGLHLDQVIESMTEIFQESITKATCNIPLLVLLQMLMTMGIHQLNFRRCCILFP